MRRAWTHVAGASNGTVLFYDQATGQADTLRLTSPARPGGGVPADGIEAGWTLVLAN